MKFIPLSQGKFALVDDADYPAVSQFKWFAQQNKSGVWYAKRKLQRSDGSWTNQYLHRFLMPGVSMIDHEDGNGLNDQRYNLRPCTQSQNNANSKLRKNKSSKFRGVTRDSRTGKYCSQAMRGSKRHYLGCFDSEEEAALAYDRAAQELFGRFAVLNFPALALAREISLGEV